MAGDRFTNRSGPALVPEEEEGLRMRERPSGWPVMYQSWDKLLFLHWEMPVEALRPLIPEPLVIDTFRDKAWVGVTPLTIFNVRPVLLPPVPYLSSFDELNVRTYVHLDGVPGVWFFSLDANSSLAVMGARLFFALPYFNADIEMTVADRSVDFRSERSGADARFLARWTIGDARAPAVPGSLDFFLLERYCLYAADEKTIYRSRIHHRPWPLQEPAELKGYEGNVVQ